MRVERGFWLSLIDARRGRVLYQVATDKLDDAELLALWAQAGRVVLQTLAATPDEDGQVEFRITASKVP